MPAELGDLVTEINYDLGNRPDLVALQGGNPSRLAVWLQDAYTDLCSKYPFNTLEATIPDEFVGMEDTYTYPQNTRAIKTISMALSDGSTPPVRRRHIKVIRRYATSSQGKPSIYAPYGPGIIVRPVPDMGYPFNWDIWQLPTIMSDIVSTLNLLPVDWFEILKKATVLRGHIALLERDKAREVYILLYGDPKAKDRPGLIAQKELQRALENVDEEYAITPLNRRYTNSV